MEKLTMDLPAHTLFLIARFGHHTVKSLNTTGLKESHMWGLSSIERRLLKYVSLHKTQATWSRKGGEVMNIRPATLDEIIAILPETKRSDKSLEKAERMFAGGTFNVITYQQDKGWHKQWPLDQRGVNVKRAWERFHTNHNAKDCSL